MTEEFVYDKTRIILVIVILSLIVSGGVILVALWPQPTPPIGDVMTNVVISTDADIISDKYADLFGSSLNAENTTMFKIDVYAFNIYYVSRMTITIEVGEGTSIIAVAVAELANEANILVGKNNFEEDQSIYANSLLINQANYVIYIILDTLIAIDFQYNVRVGE